MEADEELLDEEDNIDGEDSPVLEIDEEPEKPDDYWHKERVASPMRTTEHATQSTWRLPDGTSVSLTDLAQKSRRSQTRTAAAESLSTLQALSPPKTRTNGTKRKRQSKPVVRQAGRSAKRTAREGITVTVKERQFSLNDDGDSSLYKLARLWVDDSTPTFSVGGHAMSSQPGIKLPPPEPHTKHSQSRSPPRSVKQSIANFDELVSGKEQKSGSELKDNYVQYGKVLRTWFHSQYLHRLNRYKNRIRMYHNVPSDGTHSQSGE